MEVEKEQVVYLLTMGEYSDYSVHACFLTREAAQAYKDSFVKEGIVHEGYYNEIEECVLNPKSPVVPGYKSFFIRMSVDGEVLEVRAVSGMGNTIYPQPGWLRYETNGRAWERGIEVYTDTQERAIKIASERRLQWMANDQWIPESYYWHPLTPEIITKLFKYRDLRVAGKVQQQINLVDLDDLPYELVAFDGKIVTAGWCGTEYTDVVRRKIKIHIIGNQTLTSTSPPLYEIEPTIANILIKYFFVKPEDMELLDSELGDLK